MRAINSRLALPFLTVVLALGLSGCADMRWHNSGGNDSALEKDLAACRRDAQAKFGSSAAALGLPGSNDPRFGPMGPSQADVRMQESQAEGACMRGKGYVLVPGAK
jgi:uncharacterized protein YceK